MQTLSVKAWLVGMRYYGRSAREVVDALRSGACARREPANRHDHNAVALLISGQTVGHVDRKTAGRIARMIDDGAQCQIVFDSSRQGSENSIPIAVTLVSNRQVEVCRWKCDPDHVGIYEINVRPEGRSYFGQSTDVRARLKQHWDFLSAGLHENPELQSHWNHHGVEEMTASLVEIAPSNLRDLELARWLVERERYWVNQNGGLKKVINAAFPQPVLNEKAKLELEGERGHASIAMEKLAATMENLSAQVADAEMLLREKRAVASAKTRWTYLFASPAVRNEVEIANATILRLTQTLSETRSKYYAVSDELNQLKQRLFLV